VVRGTHGLIDRGEQGGQTEGGDGQGHQHLDQGKSAPELHAWTPSSISSTSTAPSGRPTKVAWRFTPSRCSLSSNGVTSPFDRMNTCGGGGGLSSSSSSSSSSSAALCSSGVSSTTSRPSSHNVKRSPGG